MRRAKCGRELKSGLQVSRVGCQSCLDLGSALGNSSPGGVRKARHSALELQKREGRVERFLPGRSAEPHPTITQDASYLDVTVIEGRCWPPQRAWPAERASRTVAIDLFDLLSKSNPLLGLSDLRHLIPCSRVLVEIEKISFPRLKSVIRGSSFSAASQWRLQARTPAGHRPSSASALVQGGCALDAPTLSR
jgi:hypothetical protein